MEGLLPMVLKTIKKNRVRRQYKCLCSDASQSYNVSDLFADQYSPGPAMPQPEKVAGFRTESNGHRRHKSVQIGNYFDGLSQEDTIKSNQLVRLRSRRMFSCVTGL
ncbi:unnamed protein product [Ilex paraguariensis]|uniref:Uncharacterized protein n=1 Tax=Ilex paraguariensis TaxID=185542 RepID=A0ABC8U4B1_9AQUA